MFRTNVDEMNVEPIDLREELRQGIQFGLALAPIVIRRPITSGFLKGSELHALRFIRDCLTVGPPCGVYAPAQFDKFRFRNFT